MTSRALCRIAAVGSPQRSTPQRSTLRRLLIPVVIAAAASLSGCATIIDAPVAVTTYPAPSNPPPVLRPDGRYVSTVGTFTVESFTPITSRSQLDAAQKAGRSFDWFVSAETGDPFRVREVRAKH